MSDREDVFAAFRALAEEALADGIKLWASPAETLSVLHHYDAQRERLADLEDALATTAEALENYVGDVYLYAIGESHALPATGDAFKALADPRVRAALEKKRRA